MMIIVLPHPFSWLDSNLHEGGGGWVVRRWDPCSPVHPYQYRIVFINVGRVCKHTVSPEPNIAKLLVNLCSPLPAAWTLTTTALAVRSHFIVLLLISSSFPFLLIPSIPAGGFMLCPTLFSFYRYILTLVSSLHFNNYPCQGWGIYSHTESIHSLYHTQDRKAFKWH